MQPKLNERFQSYLRQQRHLRRLTAVVGCFALIVAVGVAATNVSPQVLTQAKSAFAAVAASLWETARDVPVEQQSPRDSPPRTPLATTSTPRATAPSPETPADASARPADHDAPPAGQVLGAAATTIALPQPVVVADDVVRPYTLAVLLASIQWDVNKKFAQLATPPRVPEQVAGGGIPFLYQSAPPPAQRIDQLDGVTIRNATIIGGSVSGVAGVGTSDGAIGENASTTTFFSTLGHFTTGIIDVLSSAAATIGDLTSNTITATNATFTSATTTNFAATNASTTNLTAGSLTLNSGTGVLYASSGAVAALANGADGKVLKLSGGVPTWSADNTGSGGGSSAWATTTDNLALYPADTSQVLLIGHSATTTDGNIFELKGRRRNDPGVKTTRGRLVCCRSLARGSCSRSWRIRQAISPVKSSG